MLIKNSQFWTISLSFYFLARNSMDKKLLRWLEIIIVALFSDGWPNVSLGNLSRILSYPISFISFLFHFIFITLHFSLYFTSFYFTSYSMSFSNWISSIYAYFDFLFPYSYRRVVVHIALSLFICSGPFLVSVQKFYINIVG